MGKSKDDITAEFEKVIDTDLSELASFNGVSEDSQVYDKGFQTLLYGYIDYAKEVLVNRAVPELRDGFKPVQRYALWVLHKNKSKDFIKSENVSGSIMDYHPHNADSAYEALSRMTDSNGSFKIPMLKGDGNLGDNFSTSPPAARRYTRVKLHPYADEMMSAMNGVDLVPNFDNSATSVDVFPVSFPYYLCKSADGIAVGFSTNIPSFNVNDVCDLVAEYVTTGKNTTAIVPDFETGGYIVPTDKELDRLMRVGKGRFVVRGNIEIDGKVIVIKEVPHGVTTTKLVKDIQNEDIDGIADISDLSTNEARIEIMCRTKKRVDEVLTELYTRTSLQHSFNSNMLAIQDKKLVITGVWGIIERWVKWRREVLVKQFNFDLEKAKDSMVLVDPFIKILDNEEVKDEVIDLATRVSDEDAVKRIMDFTQCEYETAKWIIGRRLNQFRNGDKYRTQLYNLKQKVKEIKHNLSNIDDVILGDMKRVKSTIGASEYGERKTQLSQTVYKAVADLSEDSEEYVYECYYQVKDGFIKRMDYEPSYEEGAQILKGTTKSIILAVSNFGEIYRVYGEDLETSISSSLGTYIPSYADAQNDGVQILWATLADGNKHVLTYSDGFVGFLDTEEFLQGTIKSRYLRSGISEHADKLTDVREYQPNSFILAQTYEGLYALEALDNIKQKSRTARTRVWFSDDIYDTFIIPTEELAQRIPMYEDLMKKKPVELKGEINLATDESE